MTSKLLELELSLEDRISPWSSPGPGPFGWTPWGFSWGLSWGSAVPLGLVAGDPAGRWMAQPGRTGMVILRGGEVADDVSSDSEAVR
jgi:hypothetical protein